MAKVDAEFAAWMCIAGTVAAVVFGVPQIGVSILACQHKDRLCEGVPNATKIICDYASVVDEPVRAYYSHRDETYHCGLSYEYPQTLISRTNFETARNGRPLCNTGDYIKGNELGMSDMCRGSQKIIKMAFDTGVTSSDLEECLKNCASPFTDFGRKFLLSFETGSVGIYFAWWAVIVCFVYRNEIKAFFTSQNSEQNNTVHTSLISENNHSFYSTQPETQQPNHDQEVSANSNSLFNHTETVSTDSSTNVPIVYISEERNIPTAKAEYIGPQPQHIV